MRKIVSTEDGRSLFIEADDKDVNCVVYETGSHMTGQDIADELGMTRARASQIIKKSVKNVFLKLKRANSECSNTQIMSAMATVFNIKTEVEYKKFFRLFPENVKGDVNEEARRIGYC